MLPFGNIARARVDTPREAPKNRKVAENVFPHENIPGQTEKLTWIHIADSCGITGFCGISYAWKKPAGDGM